MRDGYELNAGGGGGGARLRGISCKKGDYIAFTRFY